jgi:hypothetical protein
VLLFVRLIRTSERRAQQRSSRSAYADDATDLHKAQRLIAQLRRAVEQHAELAYDDDLLPQYRQRCALPRVRR